MFTYRNPKGRKVSFVPISFCCYSTRLENSKKKKINQKISEFGASPSSMQDTGSLGMVHWDDPEGWYGEGGGRGVQDGDTCTPMVDSC